MCLPTEVLANAALRTDLQPNRLTEADANPIYDPDPTGQCAVAAPDGTCVGDTRVSDLWQWACTQV